MTQKPSILLRQLERLRERFGPEPAARKAAIVRALQRADLGTIGRIVAFHEALCFARAYPDDSRLLAAVERALAAFAGRTDLQRVRDRLVNSGIAGTDTVYPFGLCTAQWLAAHWPEHLRVEWKDLDDSARLVRTLLLYALPAEVPGLDEAPLEAPLWAGRLAGRRDSDASWLVSRAARAIGPHWVRDRVFEELDVPIRLTAGRQTPNRTLAKFEPSPVTFQDIPMRTGRPDLLSEIRRGPVAVRPVARRDAERLIDLAHESMVTRKRDLDAFAWADPRDVRLVECGGGLQFALIGVQPGRRFVFESVYGLLTLRNGVPVGYALASALLGSSEIAYNVFESFRGGEAAYILGRLLATVHALFGSDTFSIDAYQLGGHGNDEGLDSGAWWFYYKLGFRPRAPEMRPIVAREMTRIRRQPGYRTPRHTLERLVQHNLFFSLGPRRDDVMGVVKMGRVGLAVTAMVARRFGHDRERASAELAAEAGGQLGVRDWRRWPAAERRAWTTWAPVVGVLPGLARWTGPDRRALAAVIRAKGGVRESEFVRLFDSHTRLRRAILALCDRPDERRPSR